MRLRRDGRVSVVDPTRELIHRPRFRRALATGVGAVLVLVAGSSLASHHAHTVAGRVLHYAPAAVFLILVVVCARSTASELDDLAKWRGGQTAGVAMHMLVTGFGYLVALIGTLSMLSVPVGHFLLGGAIAGVVLGIAAQQSLGNVFAGFVLLLVRPISVGNHIRVRSGALGGEFYGTVTSMSLTYVSLLTERRAPQGAQLLVLGCSRRAVAAAAAGAARRCRATRDRRSWPRGEPSVTLVDNR